MRICVAGKNDIAVSVMEYLYNNNGNRFELGILCNRNEKGVNTWQKSLRKFANDRNIKEYKLEELYEFEDLIFLSMEYDRIVKPNLFKTDKLYNIHFSLLPQYKGMYTSAIPILNGEEYVGVTFHKIDSGIDTGDIIAQKKIHLSKEDTCRDLYLKYIKVGTETVIENIENVINDKITSRKQSPEKSTYFSKDYIDYSNIRINLNNTAEMIKRQIRAFSFREYQLPCVLEHPIIDIFISSIKSTEKAGTIIYKTDCSMMLSTIDYNIILFFDRFMELLDACKKGDLETVKSICTVKKHINDVNDSGWTPLIVATYNNQIEIVKFLISEGANINIKNNNGTNLLMYAKDAYVNTGDDTLFRLFYKMGLSAYEYDYNQKNLLDYIKENETDNAFKENILNILQVKKENQWNILQSKSFTI